MKKIIALTLALVLCLGLVACGEGGTANKDYENAISELRDLLEHCYKESDLRSPDYVLDTVNASVGSDRLYLLASEQEALKNLYQQFTEMGDYKQAKEIADRFSVVEKGYVSISETTVDALGQEHTSENFIGYLLDEQGRRIWKSYNSAGMGGDIWVYDDNGNLIRGTNEVHLYNKQGLRVESRSMWSEYIDSITTYTYDAQGNCVEQVCKTADGGTETIKYTYDEQGRCIQKQRILAYSHGGELEENYTYIYSYDEQGICTEIVETEANGNTSTTTYIYDEQGNCLFENVVTGASDSVTIYSKSGNLIFTAGVGAEVQDYQYENGLPISVTFTNGTTLTFDYTPAYYFDAEGLVLTE